MTATGTELQTVGDLLAQLGHISPARVRLRPAPGTATMGDVIATERLENRLCELVDGVLVEKVMGYRESLIAMAIVAALRSFVRPRKLGLISGPNGMLRILPGVVRIPDVAFVPRNRLPEGRVPVEAVPGIVPELVVEVLSQGNTAAEMERKLNEYFQAGVRLVWFVDIEARAATVYRGEADYLRLTAAESLDGADVLPGFSLSLGELFEELDMGINHASPTPER